VETSLKRAENEGTRKYMANTKTVTPKINQMKFFFLCNKNVYKMVAPIMVAAKGALEARTAKKKSVKTHPIM
jgi:hypothetical protein